VHEIAHFLIAEKGVPIIGPEENAAHAGHGAKERLQVRRSA
jgi:hypothetical protein